MRLVIVLFLLPLLAACGSQNLLQLRLIDPEANSFNDALAAEYLAYANAQSEKNHEFTAEYFAEKGMRAWRGENVPPEPVEDFLARPVKDKLSASRRVLMALLTEDVKHVVPQPAARAQLLFDCWAKQENNRKQDAPACAQELPAALVELQTVAASFGLGSEIAHDVRFPYGSAKPGRTTQRKVRAIASALKTETAYAIEIEGRADTPAAKELLERRTAALSDAFAAQGIAADRIRIKETSGQKAVYLSDDAGIKDRNLVRITVHTFKPYREPGDSH